jgi:hypothetical protein
MSTVRLPSRIAKLEAACRTSDEYDPDMTADERAPCGQNL